MKEANCKEIQILRREGVTVFGQKFFQKSI